MHNLKQKNNKISFAGNTMSKIMIEAQRKSWRFPAMAYTVLVQEREVSSLSIPSQIANVKL